MAAMTRDQASKTIGDAVIGTAADMQEKPAGQANFFATLRSKIGVASEGAILGGKYDFRPGSVEYVAASRR